jgi:glycosyltransferase involved in cell wall biosynthesis
MVRDGSRGAGEAARIAIILHDFAPGGTERIIVRLANHWAAAGRDVAILCGSEAGPARSLVSPAVAVRAPLRPTPQSSRSRARLARRLVPMIADFRPDVIGNYHLPVLAAIAQCKLATPIVAKLSNPLERSDLNPLQRALFGWRKRSLVKRIDLLVAMSGALAAEAARTLGDSAIAIQPEPIIERAERIAPRRASAPRLLVAGRLVSQKRVALAIAGFAAWDRPDARLTIAGDGEERGKLELLARKLKMSDRVVFVGLQDGLADCFARHDLLLSTSTFEGFPATLVEAIVAGLPVVATPSSVALPEIFAHESFGRIVVGNPQAIAAALEAQWLSGEVDEAARQGLAARHDAAASASAWLDMLDQIVAKAR